MSKALSLAGILTGFLILVLFGIDLAIAMPFKRASVPLDIGFLVCALVLTVLGILVYREQR